MLKAVSPIDGRYATQTRELQEFFSEFALIRYRVFVEVQYFIALCNYPLEQLVNIDEEKFDALNAIFENFDDKNAERIKEIEKTTNHDVKAVEYFLREKFDEIGLGDYKEFIHFGLTSQDINNTAIPLSIKQALDEIILPTIEKVRLLLFTNSETWKDVTLLARTHGQPASPTTMGREWRVFVERIERQLDLLKQIPHTAKFGGATGNFNAHHVAYPLVNWARFADDFSSEYLGLKRQHFTTQIEHYDNLAAILQNLTRINTILIDFCRDIWAYVSMDYFKQKVKHGEVGSSAMPHKVNPIDFENAEGNFGMANAVFEYLALKLPVSRLQRDLTDSTVLRNIGVPMAHTLIALKSVLKGVDKLLINEQKIYYDLESNWAVTAEAIQTILRRENYPNPYDALKQLTRGKEKISKENLFDFIDGLDLNEDVKDELRRVSPHNYRGNVI